MIDKYLNDDEETREMLQKRIAHLENELIVTKNEYEATLQKYLELYSNIEDKVKERSQQLREVQKKLEQKTKELEKDRETLRKSEQRFRDLFQNSPEAIVVINQDHKIIGINPAACFMFNDDKENLIDTLPYSNVPEEEKEKMLRLYHQICKSKQSFLESEIYTKDKISIPVEISSSWTQYLEQQAIVLHIHDISNRIEAERRIREAMNTINEYNQKLEQMLEERTKELIRTERHAAFSLLIQGIVHNLRNPLTVVSGGAQLILLNRDMLQEDLDSLPEAIQNALENAWKNAEVIVESAEKLVKIINSMMAKSKNDNTDEVELIDLNEIISQELEFLETDAQFKHKTRKSIYLSNEMLAAEIVPSELSQVFQNLVRNALDALYNTPDAMLEINTGRNGDSIWFSIQDNGPGIPKDLQAKIFDPFFSTKPKANSKNSKEPVGTGLGLYMCSEMIRAYNGRIDLKSQENEGTKITVYIPAAQSH